MPNQFAQIKALLLEGKLDRKGIAAEVGCQPDYVSVVACKTGIPLLKKNLRAKLRHKIINEDGYDVGLSPRQIRANLLAAGLSCRGEKSVEVSRSRWLAKQGLPASRDGHRFRRGFEVTPEARDAYKTLMREGFTAREAGERLGLVEPGQDLPAVADKAWTMGTRLGGSNGKYEPKKSSKARARFLGKIPYAGTE